MNSNYETNLKKVIKLLKFEKEILVKIRMYIIFSRIGVSMVLFGICIAILGFVFGRMPQIKIANIPHLKLVFGTFGIALFLMALGWILAKYSTIIQKKSIFPFFKKMDWTNIYSKVLTEIFLEKKLRLERIEMRNLNYQTKIHSTDIFNSVNTFHLDYDGIKIKFFIYVDIECEIVDEKEVYTTIQTNYLICENKNFNFENEIFLKHEESSFDSVFSTESVLFNNEFSLHSENEIAVKKLFTPSLIDKYVNAKISYNFYEATFKDKSIISTSKIIIPGRIYNLELIHFNWDYKTLKKTLRGIAHEILMDIESLLNDIKVIYPLI